MGEMRPQLQESMAVAVGAVVDEELRAKRSVCWPTSTEATLSQIRIKPSVSQPPAVTATAWTRTELTALAGISISIAALVLVLLVPRPGSALAGALLMACVPAGAAVMCWVDSGDGVVQAGLTLVLSLAVTGITGTAMIWLKAWHPYVLLAFPSACISSGVVRLRNVSWKVRWGRPTMGRGLWLQLALLCLGIASWAYGVGHVQRQTIGSYGLLASANVWFLLGFAALLAGGLLEMGRPEPRTWLLGVYLASMIVAIYATVPILYGVPEYAWVYKHIGIAQALGKYGLATDPLNIYEQWPVLFAAVASVSGVSHVSSISFAAWAPLAFELADALLLLGIFRLLGADRRVAWLALFMYEGLIGWVGQDYLSPQAFGYLLWLGIVAILIRWMLAMAPTHIKQGWIARARARFVTGLPRPRASSSAQRTMAMMLVSVIYFAIVAAHQLTPFFVLAGVGALVVLGLLRRGWLILLIMIAITGAYLASRYSLIVQQYGGLFSGSSVLQNAGGIKGIFHDRATTVEIIRAYTAISYSIWPVALAAIALQWRTLGRVAIPALLAFSPFMIILAQDYGGEAIYRVFLFSAPWCVLLIAGMLVRLRSALWGLVATCVCIVTLAVGLQGSYDQVSIDAFTPSELTASLWLYNHAPPGSLFVLPVDDFPDLETANFNDYNLKVIPTKPNSLPDINEANIGEVQEWIASQGYHTAYVVFSHSMAEYASFTGLPYGYAQMANVVRSRQGWSVIYHSPDVTIYLVRLPVLHT